MNISEIIKKMITQAMLARGKKPERLYIGLVEFQSLENYCKRTGVCLYPHEDWKPRFNGLQVFVIKNDPYHLAVV